MRIKIYATIIAVVSAAYLLGGCAYSEGYIHSKAKGYGFEADKISLSPAEEELISSINAALAEAKYEGIPALDDRLIAAAQEFNNYLSREEASSVPEKERSKVFKRQGVYEEGVEVFGKPKPFYVRALEKKDLEGIVEAIRRDKLNRIGAAILSDGWYNMRYFTIVAARRDFTVEPISFETPENREIKVTGKLLTKNKPVCAVLDYGDKLPETVPLKVDLENGVYEVAATLPKGKRKFTLKIAGKSGRKAGSVALKFYDKSAPKEEAKEEKKEEEGEAFPEERAEQLKYLTELFNRQRKELGGEPLPMMPDMRSALGEAIQQQISNIQSIDKTCQVKEVPEGYRFFFTYGGGTPDGMIKNFFEDPYYKLFLASNLLEGVEIGAKKFNLYADADKEKENRAVWIVGVLAKTGGKICKTECVGKEKGEAKKEAPKEEAKPEPKPEPEPAVEAQPEPKEAEAAAAEEVKEEAKPQEEKPAAEEKKEEPKKEEAKPEAKKEEPKKEEAKPEAKKEEPKKEEPKKAE